MNGTLTVDTKGLVGQLIGDGRYDLRERLGGGSMGYVYRAFDRRLETDVVVKLPRKRKLESPDSLHRFRQESKFLVKLKHPHVVSILDVGEFDGVPFFVMAYINGGSLRARQRNELGVQKPLKPQSLRRWLMEIAKALDFIHSQGCVHRDVKPDNILFNEHGHPYLSDFGLSKILPNDEDDPGHTAAGAIVGTPLFCAPELVRGEAFDGRADQYSLALTVYDVLAGTNPFEGPTASATLVNQTAVQPPPLKEFNPAVTPALWRCVSKALSKSPEARYGTCVEFAEAVLAATPTIDAARSSGTHARVGTSDRRSSANQSVADTASGTQRSSQVSRRQPLEFATKSRAQISSVIGAATGKYVVTARSPIVKAKSACPGCRARILLHPSFAGRKASCQKCHCRIMIAPDFSELLKLELESRPDVVTTAEKSQRDSASVPGEFDLVLGNELFGWKLSRKWAVCLAGTLMLLLLGLTIYFTNQASRAERERLREELHQRANPRGMEG